MSESGIETNAALAPGPACLRQWQQVQVWRIGVGCIVIPPNLDNHV